MIWRLLKFRLGALVIGFMALAAFQAQPANADAGLQLNPLKYEDSLTAGHIKSGYIDVANPSDTIVSIETSVQGFRQADLDGNLTFFNDPAITAGIKPGLTHFDLGPRESVRVTFTVDPTELPQGGVYASIFFRTVPPAATANATFINESANIGTLLLLQNGAVSAKVGQVTRLSLPFWQLGNGIGGTVEYQNSNRSNAASAFYPQLSTKVLPWGRATALTGPFIMPGSTRRFSVSRQGSYFGLLPLTVTDSTTDQATTVWVVAITGWYAIGLIIVGLWLLFEIIWQLYRRLRPPSSAMPRRPALDGLMATKTEAKKGFRILRKP